MGEELYVTGSSELLGRWDICKAIPLMWSQGHVWRLVLQSNAELLDMLQGQLEFKFVVIADNNPKQIIWEGGKSNHAFDLPDYIKQFSLPSTIEVLNEGRSGGVANLTFMNTMDIVSYDINKQKIVMLAPWKT